MMPGCLVFDSHLDAVVHLLEHRMKGHSVPRKAVHRLLREQRRAESLEPTD
jgi:hypothetical protein